MFGFKQVLILVTVLVVLGSLYYISELKANLAVSETNNATLKDGIKTQQELIESIKADVAQIQSISADMAKRDADQKVETNTLQDKFRKSADGSSRDFGALSAAKPKVAERLVNRGTANVMRCLELASGAPRTEKELNAATVEETNRECPQLANPNFKPK